MIHIRKFNEEFDEHITYNTGDKIKCRDASCLVNYGSRYNPKIDDIFEINVRKSIIDRKDEYFLINTDGRELTYPYRKDELTIFFDKISIKN